MIEYIIVAGITIAARIIYKRNEAKIKGASGERKLARAFKKMKLPGKQKILRDLLLPTTSGTTQVDVLAVTRYGVMIGEMKNYHGTVFGAVGQDYWKVQYPNGQEEKLYSPIKQNYAHLAAVSALLRDEFPNMRYYPISVFSDYATLHIQNSRNKVCTLKKVPKVIGRQLGEEIMTDEQVARITDILQRNQIKGRQARQNHITAIQLAIETEEEDLNYIKQQVMNMAKDKPVLRSSQINDQPTRSKADPVPANKRPLRELLQEIDAQQASSQNTLHGHEADRGDPYCR